MHYTLTEGQPQQINHQPGTRQIQEIDLIERYGSSS